MQVNFPVEKTSRIQSWNVKEGSFLSTGQVMLSYVELDDNKVPVPGVKRLKAVSAGVIQKLHVSKGDTVDKGSLLVTLGLCSHPTVMRDMCAECGMDLRKLDEPKAPSASVSMIHSVPDLRISMEQAQIIGKGDEERLLKQKKLVLLVDLDQTIIHTTNDNVPHNLKDVFHFQLWGHGSMWYHTRLRPRTREFLEKIGTLYELHICTFGTRSYAHTIAKYLDPEGKYFSDRILSRDECFSQNSKTANLKELFPRGDHMVCIIDDREDVWNFAPNLIHVRPYHFFRHTGDINAPPGLTKQDQDDKTGFSFNKDGTTSSVASKETATHSKNEVPHKTASSNTDTSEGKREPIDIDMEDATDSKMSTNEIENNLEVKNDLSLSDEEESASDKSEDANEGDKEESCDDDKNKSPASVALPSDPVQSENNENADPKVPDVAAVPIAEEDKKENKEDHVEDKKEDAEEKKEDAEDKKENADDKKDHAEDKKENAEDKKENAEDKKDHLDVVEDKKEDVVDSKKPSDVLEVEDQDDYLMYLEQILESIHKAFYSLHSDMLSKGDRKVPDVKTVIPYVRKKVLKNVSIVFSGVVPTNIVPSDRKNSKAYAVASSLGAVVTEKIIPPNKPGSSSEIPTTHIVAARLGTAKVNEARRYKGIHVVTTDWLWCCSERWDRVDERLFSLYKKAVLKRNPPPHCSSRSIRGDPNSIAGTSKNGAGPPAARKERTPSGRFMDTINPLLSFSMDEIESMGHEVDDICNESESSTTEEEDVFAEKTIRRRSSRSKSNEQSPDMNQSMSELNKNSSSTTSSNSESDTEVDSSAPGGCRKRKRVDKTETETEDDSLNARFRRGEALPSEVDDLNLMNQSESDEDATNDVDEEWMAQALEREFLDESSRDQE